MVGDEGHHAILRFEAEDHNREVDWIAISPVLTRAVGFIFICCTITAG
jgi:phosphinothricin acetyltransferase